MRRIFRISFIAVTAALMAACSPEASIEVEDVARAQSALTCSVPFTIDPSRSLFVTKNATILDRFSFERVMNTIFSSAGVTAPATSRALFRTWMDSNNNAAGAVIAGARHCDSTLTDPNEFGFTCPRPAEGDMAIGGQDHNPFLATSDNFFEPVGIANRFDLAPSSGANCGEYRIVFAKTTGSGRFFIIFEAVLPNPDPAAGIAACAPVVDAWRSLSNPAMTDTQRADLLDQMYFTGLSGFEPVVKADHYGFQAGNKGQIRTNQFMNSPWLLREFKTTRTCTGSTCALTIVPVTVKTNPAENLMVSSHPDSAAFTTDFLDSVTAGRLLTTDLNHVKLVTDRARNTWESNTAGEVVYRNHADSTFKAAIQTKLTTLGNELTPTQVLDRAMTQTCAGCHQNANNLGIGGGLTWPSSLGFVHINEQGDLSPALTNHFLPHRKQILEDFIADACAGALPSPIEGITIGGGPEDSAN
jgi:hypothetical protein